ncbi:MAG TPA: translocation/assembly module TamB domain-containing protein, partial [Vicinamibacterales bacterium]|nr:translocation/assembly module TamB domain-containing protein [Vicinamibacterales bacterium]
VRADLHGEALSNVDALHGTLSIDSPRLAAAGYVAERVRANARVNGRQIGIDGNAAAYGAAATFAGDVTLPDAARTGAAVAYDVHGQVTHVDLGQLPPALKVPPAATDVNADYHARGEGAVVTADVRFQPSTVAGTRIAAGSTAGVTLDGAAIAYRADATVADLDLERIGKAFRVTALAVDQYKSSVNGHIVAHGSGTDPATLDAAANGTLTSSSILGGTIPQLDFDVALAADTARVRATGSFAGFDPAVASGKPEMKGTVAGTLDVNAILAHVSTGVTPDSVQADGKVTLQPSTIGDLKIDRADLDGSYHDSTGEIRALDLVGRDVNVQASGTLALNDTGQSNLKVHADSPSLDEIGKLVDVPITGIGKVDATVTGNARELKIAGSVIGDGVKYGENGALVVSSTITATVPALTVADAHVVADTHATFVSIAGQEINELDAKTTYQQKQLDFDATAKQPQRSVGAAGSMVIHPDHQEIHLQRLGLQTAGQTWQLGQGSQATINYAHDQVAVRGLTLTNGGQQVSADGAFGGSGDALKVTLTNVDVANVDALLLRPPQLTGTLNASGTITGTTSSPAVAAEFRVDKGGVQQYRYDSLGGTVKYAGSGLTLDTRLQQNPTTFLTAKGYVPTTADGQIDLHIESTPIDLGIVQSLTTQLTKVTGTLQANVDVTGSGADPRPTGVVTIDNAAFFVVPTGVGYTNFKGKIDLLPEKVHIDNISVLDNKQSALSLSGDLAIHEQQVGGVELYVTANDFKVIDNSLGNLRVNSSIEIAGELRAPRVTGDFGVSTGQINLDEIIALTGDSAYATEATDYLTKADANSKPAPPSVFDALTMDLRMTVPDDLVVKASALRAPGAPISL